DCRISLPGARGITFPSGYEGKELLASSSEFRWPFAPDLRGSLVDLRLTLLKKGSGFVAGIQFDPTRQYAFVCAVNARFHLAIGYCFKRADFPWITLWEENLCRNDPPWNGNEQARGLEFGASPLPLSRKETLLAGPLFDTPAMAYVPARSKRAANYVLFLTTVCPGFRDISDLRVEPDSLLLIGDDGTEQTIAAQGVGDFLA